MEIFFKDIKWPCFQKKEKTLVRLLGFWKRFLDKDTYYVLAQKTRSLEAEEAGFTIDSMLCLILAQ